MSHQRAHKKKNISLRDIRNRMSEFQNMNLNSESILYQEQIYLEKKILDFDLMI